VPNSAAQVGLALSRMMRPPENDSLLSQLEDLLSRTILDQAVGIVMNRDVVTPTAALGALRQKAHDTTSSYSAGPPPSPLRAAHQGARPQWRNTTDRCVERQDHTLS